MQKASFIAAFGLLLPPVTTGCDDTIDTVIDCPAGQYYDEIAKVCVQIPTEQGTTPDGPIGEDCEFGKDPVTGECQEDPGGGTGGTGGTGDDDPIDSEPVPDPEICDTPGIQKIGHPCTDHSDCDTCYCYDEEYLGGDFRFCTVKECWGSGNGCPLGDGEFPEYACVVFTTSLIKTYDLTVDSVCMPRCGSVQECLIYGPQYNHCPEGSTLWDEATIQAASTCQVK